MTQIEFMNRLIDKHAPAVIGCTYNILFTNDIAITTVMEAVEAVRKSDSYRHETKRITNVIDRLRGKYEKMLFEVIGDRSGFFADANEAFLEDVQKHVDILYYSIKGVFDKARLEDSALLARCELARTMCEFSCIQLDKREEELRQVDSRFRRSNIGYLRLTALHKELDRLMRTMGIPCTVNLDTDTCRAAVNVLSAKLCDARLIAKAISA